MLTVQTVIDRILQEIPNAPFDKTVDTLKAGDLSRQVTGIVTTFMPTIEMIKQTIDSGANLLIPHEPLFYDHYGNVDWLADDPVYQHKRDLIGSSDLAIWRCHDYWHRIKPDGIYVGMLRQLEWETYADPDDIHVMNFPPTPIADIITHLKEKLDLPMVRVVGDTDRTVQKVGFKVGAISSRSHIQSLAEDTLEVLICGEAHEWETPEYVRDSNSAGNQQTLIVIGHQPSEEAGMAYLAEWLRERLPEDVPIQHIPSGNPLRVM